MSIADFQSITLPLLRLAASGDVQTRTAVGQLADHFKLSAEERGELLPSGNQSRFSNRVHWAIVYLQRAGLIRRLSRGMYAITDQGRTVLVDPPSRLDQKYLSQFPGIQEFQQKSPKEEVSTSPLASPSYADTPEERIDAAVEEMNEALRVELLERILAMHPSAFERLIIDLMLGMGYGADGSGRHLGRSADGGIDGVINEDVLGLDLIYLQAKRYAPANSIGVEKVREFAGALDERGATKGVFVTTSQFASPARAYAERSPKHLVLIDGEKLTDLLIRYGVAVRSFRKLDLKKLDTDYFEEIAS